ncbi:MAG: hypothetical protein LBO74_04995 [Candidatus Symbiothrix sp.]|jgi:hypothetical protein|nr:hypothetical protein [Candidatus Symbiothrix sp.]
MDKIKLKTWIKKMDVTTFCAIATAVATILYVIYTYKILKANEQQVKQSVQIQKETVRLDLFDRRYNCYVLLKKWYDNVKVANVETSVSLIVNNASDEINNEINKRGSALEEKKKKETNHEKIADINKEIATLNTEKMIHFFTKQNAEYAEIAKSEFLFEENTYKGIKDFIDAYNKFAEDTILGISNSAAWNTLQETVKSFDKKDVMGKIKDEMNMAVKIKDAKN